MERRFDGDDVREIDAPAEVVVRRDALALQAVGSRLVIVSANERIHEQLAVTGVADVVGPDGIYDRDERVGGALRRAYADAENWIRNVERPVEEQ